MNNILLIFLNDLENVDEFNEIIDEFGKNNYEMYLLDKIKEDEYFSIDSLPIMVENYKNEHKNVNKVVVLSNSRDLIFSWYRCYNSLVDDFVYFVDEDEKNYFVPEDRYYDFYYNLFEFNGIEKETIEGRLFLTEKNKTILPICYNPKSFGFFSNFNFSDKSNKKKLNKRYIFKDFEYNFNFNQDPYSEDIKIDKFNKRVVFIKGQSQYNMLRIGISYRMNFLKYLGFEAEVLDLLEDDNNRIEDIFINKKCDFIYSSNCIGIDIKLNDGRNLYDALDIPFLGTLGDHPVNQLSRILESPDKTLFRCIDEENIEYFKKYFPDKNIMLNNCSGYKNTNYKNKEFSEREIDVLFAGTLIDPIDIKRSWYKLDNNTQSILKSLVELVIKNNSLINIDNEISKMFLKYNIENNDFKYRAFIHSEVEKYIRYYKRYELVKKMGVSDLNIVCIGNVTEYNKLNKSGKLIIRDKVDYQSLLELMNNSKIVLNMTGHLYKGVTERILSAMLNGAAVVTEKDRFTESYFNDEENIILYDFNNLNIAMKKIKYYIENIDELEEIALNGQKVCIDKYDYRINLSKLPRSIRVLDEKFCDEINVTKTYLPSVEKYKRYVNKIFKSGQITNNGELVQELENRLSEYLGVENLVLVSNGTLALQLAYKLLNLEGEVITTPFSFAATTSSLVWEGLSPVFVDIDKETLNIDTRRIEEKINEKTSAIVPVHVFGNGCNVEEIKRIAKKHNLKIIYDAAHAFGVKYKEESILKYGDISTLSFHATKIFHSIEGGALVINDDELYKKAKKMINFGINENREIDCLGINAKMNEFQAAMGLCVLDDIDKIIECRKKVYGYYMNEVPKELQLQDHNENCTHNYAYFPVVFKSEEILLSAKDELNKNNIYPRRYFYPSLDNLDYIDSETIKNSNDISKRILCLPMSDDLKKEDILKILSFI